MSGSNERVDTKNPKFFRVELEGIECAKFMRCEGLEAETYIYEVEEGGLNSNTHKFYGRTRFPNIVLENGLTANNDLYDWYTQTVMTDEAVERKSGSIILEDTNGEEVKRWNFYRAIPCRWVGPRLGVNIEGPAVERFEIVHEGLEVDNS